nr:MAG TPA: hypothetical protein [Caudoviricetes sp.]
MPGLLKPGSGRKRKRLCPRTAHRCRFPITLCAWTKWKTATTWAA